MKYLMILFVGTMLMSCGVRIAYTNQVRDEFGLESVDKIKKVQFLVSTDVILVRSSKEGTSGTDDSGTLVSSSNNEQDRIIIPNGTKGVFEKFEDDGTIVVRFEMGPGKVLRFSMRPGQTNGKYFIIAEWEGNKGGKLEYGGKTYYATSASGAAYLQVLKKKLQRTKRKDRVVKGMKV
jgi:hypothetical protein